MATRFSWRRVLAALGVTFALSVTVALGGGLLWARHLLQEVAEERKAAMATGREGYLAEQRALAALPVFQPHAGGDAGALLNPRIHWRVDRGPASPEVDMGTAGSGEAEALTPPHVRWLQGRPGSERNLALDPTVSERALRAGWIDEDPAFTEGVDLTWMSKLTEYGYWSIDSVAPYGGSQPLHAVTSYPGEMDLHAWARIRLLAGLRTGGLDRAVAEVNELVRLCAGSDDLSVVIAGQGIAGETDRVLEKAGRWPHAGRPLFGQTRPYDVLRKVEAWAQLDSPPDFGADWSQLRLGRCAALRSGLTSALVVRPYLRKSHPEHFQRLGRLLDGTPECHLSSLRRDWEGPDPADPGLRFGPGDRWMHHWVGSPFPRVLGAALLFTQAGHHFDDYRRTSPKR